MSKASDDFRRVLDSKKAHRDYLANLPFGEKVALVEQMRDRSRLISRSSLRRKSDGHAPPELLKGVGE
jgi:hypothetical protein